MLRCSSVRIMMTLRMTDGGWCMVVSGNVKMTVDIVSQLPQIRLYQKTHTCYELVC